MEYTIDSPRAVVAKYATAFLWHKNWSVGLGEMTDLTSLCPANETDTSHEILWFKLKNITRVVRKLRFWLMRS